MKVTARTRRDLARRRVRLFGKRYHPPGTPPGTLSAPPEAPPPAVLTVTRYRRDRLERGTGMPAQPAGPAAGEVLWVHVQGVPSAAQLAALGSWLGLHPLALEDVQNRGQRPKLDLYGDGLFLILACPRLTPEGVEVYECSLFLGEGFVVSVLEDSEDWFAPLHRRLDDAGSRLRQRGADYLAYTLMDTVVDHAYPVLETLGERIETLELALFDTPRPAQLAEIHNLKRALLLLRRHLWPAREVLARLVREEQPWLAGELRPYLSDVYDHVVQLLELLESYRELSAALLEIYLSAQSHQLNEVIRLLTVISTIFIPLTFLVGVYGMNFTVNDSPWAMPELQWDYGYPVLWGLMLALAAGMAAYFRRRGWL